MDCRIEADSNRIEAGARRSVTHDGRVSAGVVRTIARERNKRSPSRGAVAGRIRNSARNVSNLNNATLWEGNSQIIVEGGGKAKVIQPRGVDSGGGGES